MIQVGAKSTIITNELGTAIQGATVGGVARYIRDELEANSLCLVRDDTRVMLVSCDLGGLEPDFTIGAREAMAAASGVHPRDIIIGATHTGGPSVIPSNYVKPIDTAYLGRLKHKLTKLAAETVACLVPAKIGIVQGQAKIGYNRRTCWDDGSHKMGRNRGSAGFTGIEGPEDNDQFVLYAVDRGGRKIAVLHQNTAHPCTFYGADFYSADYPGLARRLLRDALGDIPVLFFNGAFGDIGQEKLDTPVSDSGNQLKLSRCALPLAGETLRLIYATPPEDDLPLARSRGIFARSSDGHRPH